jgi:hypothetical protein
VNAFRLVRLLRTLSSEIYVIWRGGPSAGSGSPRAESRGDQRVGQADIHYADNSVQADLFLEAPLDEEEQHHLIRQLDDDVVSSYLPSFDRDQFIVTIFVGQETDSFNWPPGSDEIEEA